MEIHTEISSLRAGLAERRKKGAKIAFVPTMGNLHKGHLKLVETARDQADVLVVSIFVNPLQFGPDEDFDRYPRTVEQDASLLTEAGVDHLFLPDAKLLYPEGFALQTRVMVPEIGDILCGQLRPKHFEGVMTVVLKLFHIVAPDYAFFGRKDFQQLALIRRMVNHLNLDLSICAVDTVRDTDGLALSSRNSYLTREQRLLATALYQTLCTAKKQLLKRAPPSLISSEGYRALSSAGLTPCYFECVDEKTLEILSDNYSACNIVICASAKIGNIYLIDNVTLVLKKHPLLTPEDQNVTQEKISCK